MSTAYFDEEEKGSDGLIRQGTSAAPMQIQTSDEWQQENRTPTQKLVVMVGGFSVLIMCLVFLNNLSGKPSENVSPTSNLIAVLDPSRLARPFSVWDSSPTPYNWCVPGTLYSDTQKEGLFYVKVPKGASSTLLGVVMRIADKMGARLYGNTSIENTCMNRGHPHRHAVFHDYGNRNRSSSFLFSAVRNPAGRARSGYFYSTSKRGTQSSEEDFLSKLQNVKNMQLQYLSLRTDEVNDLDVEDVKDILQNYDFLGVVERMPESLVVLSMLAQIPLTDVVVLDGKVAGKSYAEGNCKPIEKKWTTPAVDEYIETEFQTNNELDYLLYEAANIALDLTIDELGRDLVEGNLEEFHRLTDVNKNVCSVQAVFPCPKLDKAHNEASKESCYYHDSGCGYACTDEILYSDTEREWDELRPEEEWFY